MKGFDSGKDKIQKICDTLKKETLEPAKQEARELVENAHMQAKEIVEEAKKDAEKRRKNVTEELEEKKRVFDASLSLACRQALETLKQSIEKDLFSKELKALIDKEMGDTKLIAELLNRFMSSCEEKGIEEEFIAVIPKGVSARTINELLAKRVLDKLKNKTVVAGDFAGGVQIQLKGRQITIDISDEVVRDLISHYIRRDLRDFVFHA